MSYESRLFANAKKNDTESFKKLEALANGKPANGLAMALVGKCHYEGYCVPIDKDKALDFFVKSANLEIEDDERLEWKLYKRANVYPTELAQLESLANDTANKLAVILLGKHYYEKYNQNKGLAELLFGNKDKIRALELFSKVAAVKSMSYEWDLYNRILRQDRQALKTLENLASAKPLNTLALTLLGRCYYAGNLISSDPDRALTYFTIAANLGEVVAMNCLGEMYSTGNRVKYDLEEAAKWLFKAAKKNDYKHYGSSYAFKLLAKFADNVSNPNPTVLNKLAICFEHGYGTGKPDPVKAADYYKKLAHALEANIQFVLNEGEDIYPAFQKIEMAYRYMLRNDLQVLIQRAAEINKENKQEPEKTAALAPVEELIRYIQMLQFPEAAKNFMGLSERIAGLSETFIEAKHLREFLEHRKKADNFITKIKEMMLDIKNRIPAIKWRKSVFLGLIFKNGKPKTIEEIEPELAVLGKCSPESVVLSVYSKIIRALNKMSPQYLKHSTTIKFYEEHLLKLKHYSLTEDSDDIDSLESAIAEEPVLDSTPVAASAAAPYKLSFFIQPDRSDYAAVPPQPSAPPISCPSLQSSAMPQRQSVPSLLFTLPPVPKEDPQAAAAQNDKIGKVALLV